MCGAAVSYESVCTLRLDFLECISLHEDRISGVSDLSGIVAGSIATEEFWISGKVSMN